jgi:hypothetical protein
VTRGIGKLIKGSKNNYNIYILPLIFLTVELGVDFGHFFFFFEKYSLFFTMRAPKVSQRSRSACKRCAKIRATRWRWLQGAATIFDVAVARTLKKIKNNNKKEKVFFFCFVFFF